MPIGRGTIAIVAAVVALSPGLAPGDQHVLDDQQFDMAPYDASYYGSLESMMQLTLNVADDAVITDLDVHIDIHYTWAGDLTIKLMSPSGTLIDLVSRPGMDEEADDGRGCCGESSDLVFGNVYEFDDASPISSELMGAGGDEPIDSFSLHSSGFMNEFELSTLVGEDPVGDWTMYVGDSTGGDTGVWDGFTLQINCNCPRDVDDDCGVGFTDLLVLLSTWGGCAPEEDCPGDVNGDGVVNLVDLLEVLSDWGPCV